MQLEEKVIELLSEIRDIQAKHHAEYCKISSESIAMQRESHKVQQEAIVQQQQAIKMQRKAVGVQKYALIALVPFTAVLIWLIFKR